jgi:hypothetical protein
MSVGPKNHCFEYSTGTGKDYEASIVCPDYFRRCPDDWFVSVTVVVVLTQGPAMQNDG